MASVNDFEGCIEHGVNVDSTASSTKYIDNLNTYLDKIKSMKEDDYYEGDSGTITQSIDMVSSLKSALENTGLFFEHYPEYRTKFDNVMQEMTRFKSDKSSLNPSLFSSDVNNYNNALYAAKLLKKAKDFVKDVKDYNNHPIKLYSCWKKTEQHGNSITTYTKYFNGYDKAANGGITFKPTRAAPSNWNEISGTAKYDKIENKSSSLTSASVAKSQDRYSAEGLYKSLLSALQYRQWRLAEQKPPEPPE